MALFSFKLPPSSLFFLLKINLFCIKRILHLFLSKNMFVLTDDCKPHFPLRLVHLVVFQRQSEGVLLAGTAEWNIKLRTLSDRPPHHPPHLNNNTFRKTLTHLLTSTYRSTAVLDVDAFMPQLQSYRLKPAKYYLENLLRYSGPCAKQDQVDQIGEVSLFWSIYVLSILPRVSSELASSKQRNPVSPNINERPPLPIPILVNLSPPPPIGSKSIYYARELAQPRQSQCK